MATTRKEDMASEKKLSLTWPQEYVLRESSRGWMDWAIKQAKISHISARLIFQIDWDSSVY